MFQENKARPIFRKTNISYPFVHTYVCVWGGKKCSFFGKIDVLCFLEATVLRFALLSYYRRNVWGISWLLLCATPVLWDALHKKWSFPLRIFSVNVTKFLTEMFCFNVFFLPKLLWNFLSDQVSWASFNCQFFQCDFLLVVRADLLLW